MEQKNVGVESKTKVHVGVWRLPRSFSVLNKLYKKNHLLVSKHSVRKEK